MGMWVGFKHLNALNSEDSFKFLPGLNEIPYLQLSMMATRKGFTLTYILVVYSLRCLWKWDEPPQWYLCGWSGCSEPISFSHQVGKTPGKHYERSCLRVSFLAPSTIINITVPHEISHVWCACVCVCMCVCVFVCVSTVYQVCSGIGLPKDHNHHNYMYIFIRLL